MKILFKLTTRGRPELMFRAIDSIINNISDKDNYSISVSADTDDLEMRASDIIEQLGQRYDEEIILNYGKSKSKIDAINRDIDKIDYNWDILVNVSDDQYFIENGFDGVIRDAFWISAPEVRHSNFGSTHIMETLNLDQFIHFPDGNRSDFSTMSIMGRDYYNRDKRIYHSGYKSICCDVDATEEAKLRGCYKFVNAQIFFHDHYQWKDGKVCYQPEKFDATYQKNETKEIHDADKAFLEERRKQNFGVI